MSVYVDDSKMPFGRMLMCHMTADTTAELLAMADMIGVRKKWIQKAGTYQEHFDICQTKRRVALARGAIATTARAEARRRLRKLNVAPSRPGSRHCRHCRNITWNAWDKRRRRTHVG